MNELDEHSIQGILNPLYWGSLLGGMLPARTEPVYEKIAFTTERDRNDEIYIMDTDGSNQTNITKNPGNDGGPSWSSDGTKIAFVSDRDGNYEIYIMNADGTDQRRITRTPIMVLRVGVLHGVLFRYPHVILLKIE